ncbi:C-type lectin-like domain-containing protein [Chachezhania sediminis]|uniref:DUF1292 domain-containing protein n=1 Tax=Chachezhania sediminis TaxID=2599291 RepID=UPI00131C4A7C|nr:DUF1292 domain-containing protein [Chachezhania sediminis]
MPSSTSSDSFAILKTFSYNSHSYIVVYAPDGVTWDAAQAQASSLNGQLTSIETEAENDAIFGALNGIGLAWYAESGTVQVGP